MSCTIRRAGVEDLASINDVYNHYVSRSTCTYQEAPESLESRRAWFDRHGSEHPITVAELDGRTVGWAALSPFHARSAYRFTVEDSVYVDHRYQRRGIGDALLIDLIARAHAIGHRTIVALIDASQDASVAIHAKHGFATVGRLKEVGYKFERWLDVVYMQLMITPR
jgi:phosphinothricin acetyltransferase